MSLRSFQTRVAEVLLAEKRNVILQAPTGSGKTYAALLPFLNAIDYGRDFPRKCIYSVPMRVLANQFFEKHTETGIFTKEGPLRVSIQTGEHSKDPCFEGDLIFATIDQTLSSFLLAPYSLSRTKANINAAAIAASYLVFDEFHLYDPESTLPTTIRMLEQLNGITPFLLMTATFSRNMLDGLADFLDAIVIPTTEQEQLNMNSLESQRKQRHYYIADRALSADAVIDLAIELPRSVVICNSVDRARLLFEAIQKKVEERGFTDTIVRLLHSRLIREDRNTVEEAIRRDFKKGRTEGRQIIVSTQAIEVGVDITSDVLHTELAPANAILQRAGRCARYTDEIGQVIIYEETIDQHDPTGKPLNLVNNPLPYKGQSEIFAETLRQFSQHDGQHLDFDREQEIVSVVHGLQDSLVLHKVRTDFRHLDKMREIMREGNKYGEASRLIRYVFQQQVIIHPNPDSLLNAPFSVPAFGFHPYTLKGYIEEWLHRGGDDDLNWRVKYLVEDDTETDAQSNRVRYRWEKVNGDASEAFLRQLVVVHPRLAYYDKTLGFIASEGGPWDSRLDLPDKLKEGNKHGRQYTYRLEPYADHIAFVLEAFEFVFFPEMKPLAHRLEARFGWEKGALHTATKLAVLLHDVGKLSVKWQAWVQEYQTRIEHVYDPAQVYAHTELQTEHHRMIEEQMGKRPWHAVESAIVSLPVLDTVFLSDHALTYAVFTAIARHHTAFSSHNQDFQLRTDSTRFVRQTFEKYLPRYSEIISLDLDPLVASDETNVLAEDLIVYPNNKVGGNIYINGAYIAYLLIARVLRLSDQAGTLEGGKQ